MNNCTFHTLRFIITDVRWINHVIEYGLVFNPFFSFRLIKAFAFLKSSCILREYPLRNLKRKTIRLSPREPKAGENREKRKEMIYFRDLGTLSKIS